MACKNCGSGHSEASLKALTDPASGMGPAILAHETQSIPGGYGVTLNIAGMTVHFDGRPYTIAQDVCNARKQSGTFTSEQAVWDELNAIWCERAPTRCVYKHKVATPEPVDTRRIDPALYGRYFWQWLHMFGTPPNFAQDLFISSLNRIIEVFNPDVSEYAGCSDCYTHAREYLSEHPPEAVESAADAAQWTFDFHNAVNKRLGKPCPSFQNVAHLYGWET